MNLVDAMTKSHTFIRQVGDKLLASTNADAVMPLFEYYWQQFFAHEHAEAHIANKIINEPTLKRKVNHADVDNVVNFAIDEYQHFEQLASDIAQISENNEQKMLLIKSLVMQINQHMQQEEAVIFPHLLDSLDNLKQQALVKEYLKELEYQRMQQTVSALHANI